MQSKEKLLTDLRKELAITTQEHFEVLSAVMQDKEIESLRENRAPEAGAAAPAPTLADAAGLGKRKKEALGGAAGRCCSHAPGCSLLLHMMHTLHVTSIAAAFVATICLGVHACWSTLMRGEGQLSEDSLKRWRSLISTWHES